MNESYSCDVLIIGGGGAGLSAAIAAATQGAQVIVASKTSPLRSQTVMAQGGINAALDGDWETHRDDTLKGGDGLGDDDTIAMMCQKASEAVRRLDQWGMLFDRDGAGVLAQRPFGGGSRRRTCYSGDRTGQKMVHTLVDHASTLPITWLEERMVLALDTQGKEVCGAVFLDSAGGKIDFIRAKCVVIATGGYAGIYYTMTSNATVTTGDGVAVAARAGAKLRDMEFVQFHPTTLLKSGLLMSEAARGEGAYLVNTKGERFVDELGTRDVVARAIKAQYDAGETVYLDLRHLGEATIASKLPQERHLCQVYEGLDPVCDLIPIQPSAHYTMGGIAVDKDGRTTLKNLYACGEAACNKVHGANRLGGNSLLEIVVFGDHVGGMAARDAANLSMSTHRCVVWGEQTAFIGQVLGLPCQIDFYPKRSQLGKILGVNVGLSREERYLKGVMGYIRQAQDEFPFMGVKDKSRVMNTNLIEFLEFANMLQLAEIVVVSALNRKESRGSHYRSDFPTKNDEVFGQHSISWLTDGVVHMEFEETLKVLR